MATLVAKHIYKGELILILTAPRMSLARANKKLAEIAEFEGTTTDSYVDCEGELWFEIEDAEGDLVSDPIRFVHQHAKYTLMRTGVPEREAVRLLSDEYAEQYLAQLWDRK